MKHSRSTVRDLPPDGLEPDADPYMDEAMAMVYVGDVYSLVAQDGATGEVEAKVKAADKPTTTRDEPEGDNDALWPLIR
jgi:hypothetical protein